MKRVLLIVLLVVVALAGIALERGLTFSSRQPQVTPVAREPLDTAVLAQHLAGAVRFKTV